MSIKAFAKAEGLNPRTLGWWRWRVRRDESDTQLAFTEVSVVHAAEEPTVVLALDDLDAHIVVDRLTDLELLKDVLKAIA